MEHFGQILKNLRKSRGLTQDQLAYKLNLSRSQIKNWETGRYQPDIQILILIASFFGVSVNVLIGFQSDFKDEPLQELLTHAQSTYAALNESQRERFCKQVSLFIKMIDENKETF